MDRIRTLGFLIVVRSLLRIFRFVLLFIWRTTRQILSLILAVLASMWVGIPTGVRNLSGRWVRRASIVGFPMQYYEVLQRLTTVVAFATLTVAWIIFAWLTVKVLSLII